MSKVKPPSCTPQRQTIASPFAGSWRRGADVTKKSKKGKTARDCSTTIAVRELLRLTATEKTALTKEHDKEYELVKDRSNAGLHAELKRAVPYVSDVAVLLKLGKMDLNAPDADGALVLAYKDISVESAAYCIRQGADVHKRNGKGEPILVGNTPDDVALLLLSLGFKSDEAKPAELPASFLSAVYTNDCDKVKALTTNHPDLAKKVRSSIILSARSAEMAHALIDAGADYKECWDGGILLNTRLGAILRGTPAPIIKVLIDAGAVPDGRGEPEIGLARDAATVEVLIAGGQSPNVKSKRGKTALEIALGKRHWEVAECLIAHGAELTENILYPHGGGGRTVAPASQTQMEYGGIEKSSGWRERQDRFLKMPHMLEVLLNAGAKIIEGEEGTWYKLGAYLFFSLSDCEDQPMEAHLKAAEDAFRLLFKNSKPPKDFLSHLRLSEDMSDRAVSNLLKKLIDAGVEMPSDLQSDIALYPAVAEFLLQHGAMPNSSQNSPMFRLKESNDPARLYTVLRKYNTRIDITDEDGWTPLHCLCRGWPPVDPELVRAMVQDGADVNARNKNGETPLHLVTNRALAQALIDAGADITARERFSYTPLHIACMDDKEEIIECLIHAKADVNALGDDEVTPLHLAQSAAAVKLLVQNGANLNAQDKYGDTPAMKAVRRFRATIDYNSLGALLDAGAKTDIRNKRGETLCQMMDSRAKTQADKEKIRKFFEDHGVKE